MAALFCGCLAAHADDPQRDLGITLHQMPASAAHPADAVKRRPGFAITYSNRLQSEEAEPFLRTAGEVISFTARQYDEVRSNGLWIVIPDPRHTTDAEKRMISEIKDSFRKGKIPLFICEADKLPDGWVRWDESGS